MTEPTRLHLHVRLSSIKPNKVLTSAMAVRSDRDYVASRPETLSSPFLVVRDSSKSPVIERNGADTRVAFAICLRKVQERLTMSNLPFLQKEGEISEVIQKQCEDKERKPTSRASPEPASRNKSKTSCLEVRRTPCRS